MAESKALPWRSEPRATTSAATQLQVLTRGQSGGYEPQEPQGPARPWAALAEVLLVPQAPVSQGSEEKAHDAPMRDEYGRAPGARHCSWHPWVSAPGNVQCTEAMRKPKDSGQEAIHSCPRAAAMKQG